MAQRLPRECGLTIALFPGMHRLRDQRNYDSISAQPQHQITDKKHQNGVLAVEHAWIWAALSIKWLPGYTYMYMDLGSHILEVTLSSLSGCQDICSVPLWESLSGSKLHVIQLSCSGLFCPSVGDCWGAEVWHPLVGILPGTRLQYLSVRPRLGQGCDISVSQDFAVGSTARDFAWGRVVISVNQDFAVGTTAWDFAWGRVVARTSELKTGCCRCVSRGGSRTMGLPSSVLLLVRRSRMACTNSAAAVRAGRKQPGGSNQTTEIGVCNKVG